MPEYKYYLVRVVPNFCGLDDAEIIAELDIEDDFKILSEYDLKYRNNKSSP